MPVSFPAVDYTFAAPPNVVVTGAGGFVGGALVARLGAHRRIALSGPDWREAVSGADFRDAVVVHLAARVHEPGSSAADFERDNVEKTCVLAEAAVAGGATRFVFASTIKVHGEETRKARFRPDSPPAPADAYSRSKWRAEEALREIAARTGLPVTIVRIPLTYGPGVRGNFRALVRLADTGAWLPFAALRSRRSFVHVDDLAQALLLAAAHPRAPGRAFIVAHPVPVATEELVRMLRAALGRPARLFAVPAFLLEAGATLAGMGGRMRRLTRPLEVDPQALMDELGWSPRVDLSGGIAGTVAAFRKAGAP